MKHGIEQIELAFASSPEAQAEVYLTHAERCLNEGNTLLEHGIYNADLFATVLTHADKALNIQMSERVMAKVETLMGSVDQSLDLAEHLETPLPVGPLEHLIATLRSTVVPLDRRLATTTLTMSPTLTPTETSTATATPKATATQTATSTKTQIKMPTAIPTRRPTAQPNSSYNPDQGNPNPPAGDNGNQDPPPNDP